MSESVSYSFRPVPMAVWWAQCSLFGFSGLPSHIFNVTLFAAAGCLLCLFLMKAGIGRRSSFLAAVLFVLTPIAPEMVTFSSGKTDLTGMLFMMLALCFYLEFMKTRKRSAYLISLAAVTLSVLCKEEFAILIVLIPSLELIYGSYSLRPTRKEIIIFSRRMAPFAGVIAAYGLAIIVMMRMGMIAAGGVFSSGSLPRAGVLKSMAVTFSPLSRFIFSEMAFILVGAFVFTLLAVSTLLVFRADGESGKNARRMFFFMAILVLVAPLPAYKFVFVKGVDRSMEFSHLLFFSNVGILVLIALGFEQMRKTRTWRMPAYVSMVALIPVLAWGLVHNNQVWEAKAAETSAVMSTSRELLRTPPPNARLYYKGLVWAGDGIPAGAYNSYAIVYMVYANYGREDIQVVQWKESSTEPVLGENDFLFIVDLKNARMTLVKPDGARTSAQI